MLIKIDKQHLAIWHRDCPENDHRSGMAMEILRDSEKKATLIECQHCNGRGYIPDGTKFYIDVLIDDA